MLSLTNEIHYQAIDHNPLWVTHTNHQKAEYLRAASILKLQYTQQQFYLHNKVYLILHTMVSAS